MSDKITVEQMVAHLNLLNGGCMEGCLTCELYGDECNKMIQAIRDALMERDKLFEEVHELKLELVGFKRKKPKVGREQIKEIVKKIHDTVTPSGISFAEIIIFALTELDIEVSPLRRRTSDKKGE